MCETKICSKCGEPKGIADFGKNSGQCKICRAEYNKIYREEHKSELAVRSKEYKQANKERCAAHYKAWCVLHKDAYTIQQKAYKQANKERCAAQYRAWYLLHKDACIAQKKLRNQQYALFAVYAHKLDFAEQVRESKAGFLICVCTYCGREFTPTNLQVQYRLNALKGVQAGEGRYYCSTACKTACPIYRQRKYPRGFKKATSREVPAEFRQLVLKERNYTCEKCGATEGGLHVHHIAGYTEQPMLAADSKNVLVVCKACHEGIHTQPGCLQYSYRCDVQREAEGQAA